MKKIYLLVVMVISSTVPCTAQQTAAPSVVVELFTSEGSSAALPADIVLNKLVTAARDQNLHIYPLSFHVDDLNRLGWRDPFSQKSFSTRQRWYVKRIGGEAVAVPQVVINGRQLLTGLDSSSIQASVNKALREPSSVKIRLNVLHIDHKNILASFALIGAWAGNNLAVALVERGVTMEVGQGENAGRRLTHEHLVRQFQVLAPDQPKGSFILNSPSLRHLERFSIIVFMQGQDFPEVLGATQLDLLALP